jgi:hypothetical protein
MTENSPMEQRKRDIEDEIWCGIIARDNPRGPVFNSGRFSLNNPNFASGYYGTPELEENFGTYQPRGTAMRKALESKKEKLIW